jgi:hypothetical protein
VGPTGNRRRYPAVAATLVAASVCVALLAACGEASDRDLCTQYAQLRDTAQQVTELDPSSATANDVVTIVDSMLAELDQVQAASDGRYDLAISDFRLQLIGLRESASQLGDAALTTARPLLADSAADAVTSYRLLQQRLDVACPTASAT